RRALRGVPGAAGRRLGARSRHRVSGGVRRAGASRRMAAQPERCEGACRYRAGRCELDVERGRLGSRFVDVRKGRLVRGTAGEPWADRVLRPAVREWIKGDASPTARTLRLNA